MKRYEFEYIDNWEDPGGRWVLYADHVEAMKRIAGAPVAQGLTLDLIREISNAYDPNVRNFVMSGLERARAILAQAAPSASAPKDCHDDDDLHN